MSNQSNKTKCQLGCWGLAAAAALLTFVMLLAVAGFKFMAALFLAALVFIFLGVLLMWLFCTPLPAPHHASAPAAGGNAAGSPKGAAAGTAAAAGATAAVATASTAPKADAAASADAKAQDAKAKADAAAPKKAEAAAAKKADTTAKKKADTAAKKTAGTAAKTAADADGKATAEAAADKKAAAAAKKKADAAAKKKADTAAKKKADAAAKKKADADAKAAAAASTPDYDGDGALEGADEGTRPEALDAPRGGAADNLKEIKGIGPKLEKLCNALGFYHFDQIANWSADEVAWVNANLEGFKGRVSRDGWVAQAKILAAGGDTEFSKRVDEGDVY